MNLNNQFHIGDLVYLKTDENQQERIVTGILVRQSSLIYMLTQGTDETEHYDFEISIERDMHKVLNISVEQ